MSNLAIPCAVCDEPLDVIQAKDAELGLVCPECKVRLRWAHAWLSKNETGIRGCKHRYIPGNQIDE